MYNLDFEILIKRNVPFSIRKVKMLALLAALISPIVSLYNQFLTYRQAVNLDLVVTGQVRILRYYLNQRFDLGNDRITIQDGILDDILYIFLESENQPVYLPEFITGSTIDFTVRIPTELQMLEGEIKGFLDRYKLASKRYQIIYFTPNGQNLPPQN